MPRTAEVDLLPKIGAEQVPVIAVKAGNPLKFRRPGLVLAPAIVAVVAGRIRAVALGIAMASTVRRMKKIPSIIRRSLLRTGPDVLSAGPSAAPPIPQSTCRSPVPP